MSNTLRHIVTEEALKYETLEAVTFTTFGFNQDFFENNVLPTLFDIDENREPVRRNAVNTALERTAVSVFYDASESVRVGGTYRYQVSGVNNPQGVFHPKLIILAGKWNTQSEENDGEPERRITIIATSANLSYAGWGKNQEVAARMYLQTGDQQAAKELVEALSWFEMTNPVLEENQLDAIARCRQILTQLDEYRLAPRFREADAQFYFSPLHEKGFLPELLRSSRKQWDRLLVFSPYWGSVANHVERLKVRDIKLVPAFNLRLGRFGLGKKDLEEYLANRTPDEPRLVLRRISENKEGRFWHAKMYFLADKETDEYRLAVGSVNFTDMALKGKDGNTEAMLIFDCDGREWRGFRPQTLALELDDALLPDENDEMEMAPAPFDSHVLFDWKTKQYRVNLVHKQGHSAKNCSVHLPGDIVLDADQGLDNKKVIAGDKLPDSSSYQVSYLEDGEKRRFYGLITEVNLEFSERNYTRALSIWEILESWKKPVEDAGLQLITRELNGDAGEGDMAVPDEPPTEPGIDLLNFYDFYRSFYERSKKMAEVRTDPIALRNYLYIRSDSVYRLARKVADQENSNPVYAYLLLLECHSLFERHKKAVTEKQFLKDLRGWLTKAADALSAAAPAELGKATKAEALEWFEKELKGAWQR